MGILDTFPQDGTREEQEAWVIARVLVGRRVNFLELGRKLSMVQELKEPDYLKFYSVNKEDKSDESVSHE